MLSTHIRACLQHVADLRFRLKPAVPVKRLSLNPIIKPEMLPDNEGDNINGPSLIRAPDWLPGRLGKYYLYFAHHRGSYIRLAYADRLEGPWKIHPPGCLRLAQVRTCHDHIASPDVHVDQERRQVRMYFHGPTGCGHQKSFVALSGDGRNFEPRDEVLGSFYLRVVTRDHQWFGMAKGGEMYVSEDGLTNFEPLPVSAFKLRDRQANSPGSVRHVALQVIGSTLFVYYTRIGDAPERIFRSRINLATSPEAWTARHPELFLKPETCWEGANLPLRPSKSGRSKKLENALRDPAIFVEGERVFLLYSVAGEAGIAIAELVQPGGPKAPDDVN